MQSNTILFLHGTATYTYRYYIGFVHNSHAGSYLSVLIHTDSYHSRECVIGHIEAVLKRHSYHLMGYHN